MLSAEFLTSCSVGGLPISSMYKDKACADEFTLFCWSTFGAIKNSEKAKKATDAGGLIASKHECINISKSQKSALQTHLSKVQNYLVWGISFKQATHIFLWHGQAV